MNHAGHQRGATARVRKEPPPPDALAYRVPDACRTAGIGRTKLYELAAQGRLRLIRIDGRTLVDGDSLRALLRPAT